jgi:hypothetical protein
VIELYDLSVPTEDSPSEPVPLKVEHKGHEASLPIIESKLGEKRTIWPMVWTGRMIPFCWVHIQARM